MTFDTNNSLANFYLIIFLFLFSFKNLNCEGEEDYSISNCIVDENGQYLLTDEQCFNKLLIFNNKNLQANHFAKSKGGDIVIEFTESNQNGESTNSRIFYGFRENGQPFFSDESYTREISIYTFSQNENLKLDNSKSLFVTINNEANIEDQYLLSINKYNSLVELYDFNNNNNIYQVMSFNDFFQLNENELSPPCKCEVFELKEHSSSAYILVLIPNYKIISLISHAPFIKIFGFSSFNSNPYEINRITFEYFVNKKILDVFLMDDNEQNKIL